MPPPDLIIGIDLGTTNSLVAYCDERGPRIIPSPPDPLTGQSHLHLPSVVHIDPTTGTVTVGHEARRHAVERPTETIFSIKRLMGRGLADVQPELPFLPYTVAPHLAPPLTSPLAAQATPPQTTPQATPQVTPPTDPSSDPASGPLDSPPAQSQLDVVIGPRRYSPQQISAFILAELKRWAQAHFASLGDTREVKKAVITVPAYFDDAQRQATRDAGAIAGLDVVRIVNEPTAAALAYGLDKQSPHAGTGTVAVYDLGGGTFDISILRIESGVFRVLSTNGDTHLGGDDLDREIISLVHREISAQLGHPVDFPPSTRQALRNFAESVKIRLSTEPAASLEIDLGHHNGQSQTYRRTITRPEFLALLQPHLTRSLHRCALALRDAGIEPGQPAKAGGGGEARGGAEAVGGIDRVVMVGGSTYIPHVREAVAGFFGAEAYTALNPMQVVALGAAVQGAILARVNRDLLLQDILPLSLGIETMGGAFSKLLVKGRTIPAMADELFSTYVDGQTNVKIHVLQGERELAADCRSLGQFILSGIPPMPAGLPKIKVRFLVDASGVLTVSATEQRSETRASIQVLPSYGLTRDEVTQMVRDSVAHARDDMLAHRLIDLRNQVTLDTAAIEKSLAIAGEDLDPAYRHDLLTRLQQVRTLAQGTDAEALHQALTALDKASTPLAELAVTKTLKSTT